MPAGKRPAGLILRTDAAPPRRRVRFYFLALESCGLPAENIGSQNRLLAVDRLRGLVMILMALDHARLFFLRSYIEPGDPGETTPALFLTWWLPHLCAPVFVYLAGLAIALWQERHGHQSSAAGHLVSRGAWLLLLEITVVAWGFRVFSIGTTFWLQVIWVLGASMLLLSPLLRAPRRVLALGALLVLLGHNLLDGVDAVDLGPAAWLWRLFLEPGSVASWGVWEIQVLWPVLPWTALMLLGYSSLDFFLQEPGARRRRSIQLGSILIAAFFVLRLIDLYGDSDQWQLQNRGGVYTLLDFFATTKHPPSLLFLLMTMGPAFLLFAWLDGPSETKADPLALIGRVPLFFYIVHLPLLNLMAAAWLTFAHPEGGSFWWRNSFDTWPDSYRPSLIPVYAGWLASLALLFPVCRAYDRLRPRSAWLRRFL